MEVELWNTEMNAAIAVAIDYKTLPHGPEVSKLRIGPLSPVLPNEQLARSAAPRPAPR
jgi:hypothetical protein